MKSWQITLALLTQCMFRGAASTLGLAQAISAGIHVPVRLINPFQVFTLDSSKLDVQNMVNQSPLFAVASGLALRAGKK